MVIALATERGRQTHLSTREVVIRKPRQGL